MVIGCGGDGDLFPLYMVSFGRLAAPDVSASVTHDVAVGGRVLLTSGLDGLLVC